MHAIILMGGAAASETLIRGYICTIGGCSTPKNSLERTLHCSAHSEVQLHFMSTRCIGLGSFEAALVFEV